MFRDLSRAQQRFLGLVGPLRARPDSDGRPVRYVVSPEARAMLVLQAAATGTDRGGLLFGHRFPGQVTVLAAAPAGYSGWHPQLRTDPLACDERYALGWSDCLAWQHGEHLPMDWVGTWVLRADSQLGAAEADLVWLRQGQDTGLFDVEHALLCVGREDGVLAARAYTVDPTDGSIGVHRVDI
jgi:hypothetical protein